MKTYPKMKDSGIKWVGKIPEDWNLQKIKHTSYVKGRIGWQGLRTDEYTDKGPFLITGTDFKNGKIDWKNCNHVEQWRFEQDLHIQIKENDILITKDGTIGKIAFIDNLPDQTTLNSGVMVLRPVNNAYDPQFLFWILKSQQFTEFINFIKTGSTINHLYQEKFENFQFVLPESFNEQKIIFDYLNEIIPQINSELEKNQNLVNLLKEKRKSLINELVTKGLDPSVQMKDSGIEGIGEIPESWKVKKIKSITKCLDGRRIPLNGVERSSMSGDIPYYGASGMVDNINDYIFDEKLVCFSEDGDNLRSRILPIAFMIEGKSWVNNHAHVLRPTKINGIFLTYCLNSLDLIPHLEGATRVKLNQSTMNSIPLPYPPSNEQKQISEYLDKETIKITELITKINSKIKKLQEFSQKIISDVTTGKIDVREAVA